jgi:hypothetical protein
MISQPTDTFGQSEIQIFKNLQGRGIWMPPDVVVADEQHRLAFRIRV